jgi:uncharacterized protein (TIGR03435 family)
VYYNVQGRTIPEFARLVEGYLRGPVTDATGLIGKYDFDIFFNPGPDIFNPGPDITEAPTLPSAIQSTGLKLESAKAPVDVIVVDHVEKTPTEN